jgi:hypothetical protein
MTALPEARLLEMVFPDHANHLGTLFGGLALAWMDKAAFIVASRHARRVHHRPLRDDRAGFQRFADRRACAPCRQSERMIFSTRFPLDACLGCRPR